jgi:hypothetical protein
MIIQAFARRSIAPIPHSLAATMNDVAIVLPGDVCAFVSEGYSHNIGAHTCATGDISSGVRAFREVAETGYRGEADRGEHVTSYDGAHVSHEQGHLHARLYTHRL